MLAITRGQSPFFGNAYARLLRLHTRVATMRVRCRRRRPAGQRYSTGMSRRPTSLR